MERLMRKFSIGVMRLIRMMRFIWLLCLKSNNQTSFNQNINYVYAQKTPPTQKPNDPLVSGHRRGSARLGLLSPNARRRQ